MKAGGVALTFLEDACFIRNLHRVPPEVVVHLVEYFLLCPTLVVELDDFFLGHVPLVGQYDPVDIHVVAALLKELKLGWNFTVAFFANKAS